MFGDFKCKFFFSNSTRINVALATGCHVLFVFALCHVLVLCPTCPSRSSVSLVESNPRGIRTRQSLVSSFLD